MRPRFSGAVIPLPALLIAGRVSAQERPDSYGLKPGDQLDISFHTSPGEEVPEQISFWGQIVSVVTSVAILINVSS